MGSQFNMNAVWSRAVELVRDNFQLLAIIAGVFLLLPTMAAYLLIPDFQTLIDPAADPEETAARLQAELGPLVIVGLIAGLFNFAGYGALIALMGPSRPTVGTALKRGIAVVPSTLAVLILFAIVYLLGTIAVVVPISLLATLGGTTVLTLLAVLITVLFVVWLMARLSMTLPALVLGDTLNPVKAMLHSFRLTAPRQAAIVLFWVVLTVVYVVISLVVTGIFSLVAALLGTGPAALVLLGFVNGVLAMAVGVLLCAIATAMYEQLAGPDPERIERTFE